jgi:hypothetical protein
MVLEAKHTMQAAHKNARQCGKALYASQGWSTKCARQAQISLAMNQELTSSATKNPSQNNPGAGLDISICDGHQEAMKYRPRNGHEISGVLRVN